MRLYLKNFGMIVTAFTLIIGLMGLMVWLFVNHWIIASIVFLLAVCAYLSINITNNELAVIEEKRKEEEREKDRIEMYKRYSETPAQKAAREALEKAEARNKVIGDVLEDIENNSDE